MTEILEYLVPGIADGAIYGLCALGLVLTYKTSGVFNFAHGALAAAAAYAFYEFRTLQGLPWPIAALLALILVGVVGGLLLERVAAWLADAPPVMHVVATVGLLVFIQSLATAIYGAANIRTFTDFLPQEGFHVGRVLVSGGDMITTGFGLVATGALFLFFKRARLGVAMTAVVDNPNLLSLDGTNPATVRRLAWILGSCFASISGMLLAPKLGVDVNTLILLVIAAYGAAAIGFFNSLPLTFLGGIIIGVLIDTLPYFLQDVNNRSVQALPNNVPFFVLFAALLFVPGRKFAQYGDRTVRRFRPIKQYSPRVTGGGLLAGGLVLVVLPHVVNSADIGQYTSALGVAVIFASLALITWTSGQISLCHLGFAAIGATTTGHALQAGFPWPLAVISGGLVAVPAGAIVAVPAIRLSGIYVAIATFGFGIILQTFFYPTFLMFGVLNRVEVPRPDFLGFDFTDDTTYYYLTLLVAVLCCAGIVLVRRSRLGRLLTGLSDSPTALDAHGANTNITRSVVFCLSAFLAGVGGALLAGVPQSASGAFGGVFDFSVSLVFVAILAFCGRRPILSPFIAAFVYQVLEIYPFFSNPTVIKYLGVAFGLLAVFVAVAPGIGTAQVKPGGRAIARIRQRGGPVADRLEPAHLQLPAGPELNGHVDVRVRPEPTERLAPTLAGSGS